MGREGGEGERERGKKEKEGGRKERGREEDRDGGRVGEGEERKKTNFWYGQTNLKYISSMIIFVKLTSTPSSDNSGENCPTFIFIKILLLSHCLPTHECIELSLPKKLAGKHFGVIF